MSLYTFERMKIRNIVLLSVAYPYRGGIAQFTDYLGRKLSKRNNVTTVTFSRQYPDFLFPGKSQLVNPEDPKPQMVPHRWLDTVNPFSYAATARKIKKLQPDVLITRFWMPFFGPSMGWIAKRMKGTLRLAILDNVIPHEKRKMDQVLTRFFLRQHDGFVCLSKKVESELLSLDPQARVICLNHPIYDQFGEKITRESALQTLGLNPSKKYILFFGFIRAYKGLDVLLEAMSGVDETVELIVAGEVYGSFDAYQKIIDERQLSARVHLFNRYISDDEVAAYFCASEALVLPYKSATQSGLSAIALHFGCPTIATNVGGLAEVVKDRVNGLVVEPNRPAELTKAINLFFADGLRETFEKALSEEKSEYSWDSFVTRLEAFIESFDSPQSTDK